jgi:hypothetical protein
MTTVVTSHALNCHLFPTGRIFAIDNIRTR